MGRVPPEKRRTSRGRFHRFVTVREDLSWAKEKKPDSGGNMETMRRGCLDRSTHPWQKNVWILRMETFLLVWSRLLWEQATQSNDNDGKAIDQQKNKMWVCGKRTDTKHQTQLFGCFACILVLLLSTRKNRWRGWSKSYFFLFGMNLSNLLPWE